MKLQILITLALLLWLGSSSRAFGQISPTSSQSLPKLYLQVLNGISPNHVDIAIDGRVLFSDAGPGQRFSAMALPENRFKLTIIDITTGYQKKLQLNLEEGGYYTLILTGDFQLLSPETKGEPGVDQDVRVTAAVLSNKGAAGQPPVRVRLVNGLLEDSVKIQGPGKQQWVIPPMQTEVLSGLPHSLYLKAIVRDVVRSLYLGQDAPAKNIAVVFYPSGDSFSFRAMTEYTPEGMAMEVKQKDEAGSHVDQ